MDIEAIVKKYAGGLLGVTYRSAENVLRAALTEADAALAMEHNLAMLQVEAAHAIELRAYEATVANLEERIRQLEADKAEYDRRIVAVGGVAINSVSREHHEAEVSRLNDLYEKAVAGRQEFRKRVRELEAQRVPALHAEQIRVAAVAAIREVTGCPDIKGNDGVYLTDALIVNLLAAAPEPKEGE